MRLTVLVCFFIGASGSARGQNTPRPIFTDSSSVRIMAHVGSHPNVRWLINVLRQVGGTYPQPKIDELADSLVARALDSRAVSGDTSRYRAANDAVIALMLAGSGATASGVPYRGAFARLVKIHQTAQVVATRRRALAGLLMLPDRGQALAYLGNVAESSGPTAYTAVDYLITDANGLSWSGGRPTPAQAQASTAALHELVMRHRVSDPRASHLLEGWSVAHP